MRKMSGLTIVLAWLLVLTALVKADDIPLVIQGKTETVIKELPFFVVAPAGADLYFWTTPAGVEFIEKGEALLVNKAPAGRLTFGLKTLTINWDAKKIDTRTGSISVVVGDLPPGPGPGPKPDPDPPKPDPTPTPTGGLTVLISYESLDKSKYPSSQTAILTSVPVREYLKAKCVADPAAGDNKAYRIWDKDETGAGDAKLWQELAARPRASMPWIYISNGKAVYEGPLPLTPDATIELLKKYGG